MHILPPVTAEGFDGFHHPRFAECLEYSEQLSQIKCVGRLLATKMAEKAIVTAALLINDESSSSDEGDLDSEFPAIFGGPLFLAL